MISDECHWILLITISQRRFRQWRGAITWTNVAYSYHFEGWLWCHHNVNNIHVIHWEHASLNKRPLLKIMTCCLFGAKLLSEPMVIYCELNQYLFHFQAGPSVIFIKENWFENIVCTMLAFLWALTHCGLVTPYGGRDLGQHWLRWWLGAVNVDWSSVKSSDIHIRAISQEMPQPSMTKVCLKITYLKFHLIFPGANELMR